MKYKLFPDSYIYIIILLAITVLLSFFSFLLSVIPFLLAIFVAYFFRVPLINNLVFEKNTIYGPAWGKVTNIEEIFENEKKYNLISIFLSVFDVHFQTMPCDGEIISVDYNKGEFLNALNPESAKINEHSIVKVKTKDDEIIEISQIAGIIARRIITFSKKNENLKTAEIFGLIKFGSRVNIKIPAEHKLLIEIGSRINGFMTPLAKR